MTADQAEHAARNAQARQDARPAETAGTRERCERWNFLHYYVRFGPTTMTPEEWAEYETLSATFDPRD